MAKGMLERELLKEAPTHVSSHRDVVNLIEDGLRRWCILV